MIPLPTVPKISKEDAEKAVFEIEGLYPGYGVTFGNVLRRVLLSSLEGAAITEVKIKGVNHEFSTIPGVLEDVVVILMNLKKVRFQVFSNEPQTATISVKGEKEVKARDFKVSSQVKIINPEQHIATITKSTVTFAIEATIEKGVGYMPLEKKERKKVSVGTLSLDAIFNPVKNVRLAVENIRVGKRTDFDKLILELETDGTINPKDALMASLNIIKDHFNLFLKPFEKSEEKEKEKKDKKPAKKAKKEIKSKGKKK